MANIIIKISNQNLLEWSHFADWVNGTSVAPTEHTLSGASASISRETSIVKIGTYSASVTRVGADASLYHDLSSFADYQGRKITFGCWVYATVASRARLSISDGVGSTNGSYHTGGSSWEFLEVTRNIDIAATRLRSEMQINTGNTTSYFDGGVLCQGDASVTILTDIADIGEWKTSNKYRSQSYDVPRREGSRIPNMRLEEKSVSSKGMVIGATPTAKRTSFDALMRALNSYIKKPNGDIENKNLYFYDDRYYKCHVNSADPNEIAASRISEVSMKFDIFDPFMIEVNKTRVNQALSGTTTFTVANGGTAITRPKIAVTNSSSNITSVVIENLTTGQKFSYTGTIITGTDLVLCSDELTVENNGTSDLTNVTNEIGIFLTPGDNEFKITGVVSGDIDVDFFQRWY